jgi:magnesium chelatase subunit H
VPRFDSYGRLAGAELIPLEELGRPRIDVVITLSGIFRDLLPLQIKLLAEAAFLAASADEPAGQNFVRKHALAYQASTAATSRPPRCACSATPKAPTARTSTT